MKRLVAFLMCLVTVLLAVGCTGVAEEIQPYASSLIGTESISCYHLGNGKVKYTVDISALRSMDKIGFKVISVQEYNEGLGWKSKMNVYNEFAYGVGMHAYSVTYQGTPGKQYRAFVRFYAEDDGVSDTKNMYSPASIPD